MLPSFGFQEILLLGIIALVVVGPKDLPLLLRKLGKWTAKLRGMAQEFRTGFDELARQAELDELKREVEALRRTATFSDIRNEMQKPLASLDTYVGGYTPPDATPEPTPPAPEPTAAPEAAAIAPAAPSPSPEEHTQPAPVVHSAP